MAARSHVLVNFLSFNSEEQRVCIRVQQLAATALLRLRHGILHQVSLHQGILQVLGQVQHVIVHVHRSVERQPALVDLRGGQVVITDVCPRKVRAGSQPPELVLLGGAYRLSVHPLAEVFHGLSKDAVVYGFGQVFLKVVRGFFPQHSRAPSRGSAQRGGSGGFSSSAYQETYTAEGCDNAAHILRCHSLSAPS